MLGPISAAARGAARVVARTAVPVRSAGKDAAVRQWHESSRVGASQRETAISACMAAAWSLGITVASVLALNSGSDQGGVASRLDEFGSSI